jgi:hypothetical protein
MIIRNHRYYYHYHITIHCNVRFLSTLALWSGWHGIKLVRKKPGNAACIVRETNQGDWNNLRRL